MDVPSNAGVTVRKPTKRRNVLTHIRIGIVESVREIIIEVDEVNPDLMKKLEAALAGDGGVLWLTDRKGRQTGINSARIAFIEIDPTISTSGPGFAP